MRDHEEVKVAFHGAVAVNNGAGSNVSVRKGTGLAAAVKGVESS